LLIDIKKFGQLLFAPNNVLYQQKCSRKKWKNRGRVQNSKYNLMLNKSIRRAEKVMLKFGCSQNHKRNILIVTNTGEKTKLFGRKHWERKIRTTQSLCRPIYFAFDVAREAGCSDDGPSSRSQASNKRKRMDSRGTKWICAVCCACPLSPEQRAAAAAAALGG